MLVYQRVMGTMIVLWLEPHMSWERRPPIWLYSPLVSESALPSMEKGHMSFEANKKPGPYSMNCRCVFGLCVKFLSTRSQALEESACFNMFHDVL